MNSLLISNPRTVLDKQLGLLEGEILRSSRQSVHESGKVASPTHRPLSPPPAQEYHWYSFLLEAESTRGSWCGRKDYVNGPFGNRTCDFPACSAVPQPTAPPGALKLLRLTMKITLTSSISSRSF
jgi:hypothetical protein